VLAGSGAPGNADGDLSSARLSDPFGIAVDKLNNIYLADGGESNSIRRIAPDGQVITLAGGSEGFADGQGRASLFNTPSGIAIDRAGNLYVADTSNNCIRKISPGGLVSTLAGDRVAGYRDGAAASARFNGPLGVAVDDNGVVYVADTYNDRIRKIDRQGMVSTVAGGISAGFNDGAASLALFNTPCGIAVDGQGNLYVADSGNHRIRRIGPDGQVSTVAGSGLRGTNDGKAAEAEFSSPLGIAVTHDGFLYVTDSDSGRVRQITPQGVVNTIAGAGTGSADGRLVAARFSRPAGIAVDRDGNLLVADAANYLVRKIAPAGNGSGAVMAAESAVVMPNLSSLSLPQQLPWPVPPQNRWHEITATIGEARGGNGQDRDHLHRGIDIQAPEGAPVLSVYDEKVSSPISIWGAGGLNEGIRVGVMTYVHLRVGRNRDDSEIDSSKFSLARDETGAVTAVRVKRGTRLRVGDQIGSVNRYYHVHLNFAPWGAELNPLALRPVGFSDRVPPVIEKNGIEIVNQQGAPFTKKENGRLVIGGDVDIIVSAYDQTDGSNRRRRLGLYRIGYQVFDEDGAPARGFEQPRYNIEFNRLPVNQRRAVEIAYAEGSGISVYSGFTRFRYIVTNIVRDGRAEDGAWSTSELAPGNYTLRILAEDYFGNRASGKQTELKMKIVSLP